jgi:acyl-CoA synthetase (AMP-forming)/AMP-acid ligase II
MGKVRENATMWVYPEIRTLGDIFTYYNRHDPGRIAFIAGGTRISYGEVEAIANQIANGLIASGVNRGDRVVFYGKNSADYFYAMFGAVKAGAIFVPMNWRLSIPELGVILCDCTPVFAFIEQEFAANWAAIVQEAGSVGETILIDAEHPITTWSDKYPSSVPKVESRGDDAAILLYTSGTTGHPKGVIHTHASLSFSRLCEHLEEAYCWKDGDLFLLPLPNFHLLGVSLSLQCLYNGVAISILRQFDPGAMLAAIASDRPTLLVLTPTMIQMLLDHPDAVCGFANLAGPDQTSPHDDAVSIHAVLWADRDQRPGFSAAPQRTRFDQREQIAILRAALAARIAANCRFRWQ